MKPKAPLPRKRAPRTLGNAKGDFVVPDDFDDPLPEFEDEFYRVDDLLADGLEALRRSMIRKSGSRRSRQ